MKIPGFIINISLIAVFLPLSLFSQTNIEEVARVEASNECLNQSEIFNKLISKAGSWNVENGYLVQKDENAVNARTFISGYQWVDCKVTAKIKVTNCATVPESGFSIKEATPKTTNHIEINGAKVNYLSFSNSNVTRDYPVNNSPLLCVKNGGSVDCLQMDNIYCNGINNVVDAQGIISHISASNIIHTNAAGEGTFKANEKITIPDIVLTNYTGNEPTCGPGIFLRTRGEGYMERQVVNGYVNKNKIKTVLVLGNSITLHQPKPEIGWIGNWGMAASVKDSDFVHLLIRDIHWKDTSVVVKFRNIADFERNYTSFPLSSLDSLRNPDMLILKISENVNGQKALKDNFIFWYDKLVKYIAPKDQSIKVIVDGFWKNENVNKPIKEYAIKNNYLYVTTTSLSKDTTNTAKGRFTHEGVAAHPSDKGMRMIEQQIWSCIQDYFKK